MKTKFNNPELTHVWANQTQSNGKGSSMFFENESIYSYGYHFKIAQIVDFDNRKAVLFNNKSYSNTTNKHQSLVKRSIPSHYPIFNVVYFPSDLQCITAHRDNLAEYIKHAETHRENTKTARKLKEANLNMVNYYLNNFKNYCKFFNISDLSKLTFSSLHGLSIEERYNSLVLWADEYLNSDIYKNWLIKKAEDEKKQEEKRLIEKAEQIQKFREFKVSCVWGIGTNLLRFNKETDEIETSGGVKMPKNIFFDAYQRLKNNTLSIGQHIGSYRFNGSDNNILMIGCHKIDIKEVEAVVSFVG
ncbi:MAG: hypothetical protein ACK5XN_00540 [Bacteroidota bacterium]